MGSRGHRIAGHTILLLSTMLAGANCGEEGGPSGGQDLSDVLVAALYSSDELAAISRDDHAVVFTVPSGGGRPEAMTFSPDGSRLYVLHTNDGTVRVIETATSAVVATMTVPVSDESGIAITPDGRFLYVTSLYVTSFGQIASRISVISTESQAVVDSITFGASGLTGAIAIAPDGAFAYAPVNGLGVVVIATATNRPVDTVGVEVFPHAIALTPDGAYALVPGDNATIIVIAVPGNVPVDTIPVGAGTTAIAVRDNGDIAYVANAADNSISVVSLASGTVTETIAVPGQPLDLVLAPDGRFIYVALNDSVLVLSATTYDVVATIEASNPWHLAIR